MAAVTQENTDVNLNLKKVIDILNEFLKKLSNEGFISEWSLEYHYDPPQNLPDFTKFIPAIQNLIFQLQTTVDSSISVGSERNKPDESSESSNKTETVQPKKVDPQFVQIKANKKEIERRISAFITRKRLEVDEINVQEFCNRPRTTTEPEYSCARIDAVLVHRTGSKSHVKVSKVVNQWGPQTRLLSYNQPSCSRDSSSSKEKGIGSDHISQPIEERIKNMESHLKLKSGQPVSTEIYERLKNLENRILYLEGLSPDYFRSTPAKLQRLNPSPQKPSRKYSHEDIVDIDARIQTLRRVLQQKEVTSKD